MEEKISLYIDKGIEFAITYIPKLALAFLLLYVGFKLIRRLTQLVRKSLGNSSFSEEIVSFISSLVDIGLKVFLLLMVAGVVGIDTTALVGILAAISFAVGLALQGSLANFAAGIIILVFRPYKVGDWIEVQDKFGKVEEIQIFNTIMFTPGQKTLIIPNGQVIEGIVTNFSQRGNIRLEMNVTMPYEESFPKVKQIILDTLSTIPKVLQQPAPEIGIETFDSHNVVLTIRPYVAPDDYWPVTFEAHEKIKQAFHANNIKVAYSEGIELGSIGE